MIDSIRALVDIISREELESELWLISSQGRSWNQSLVACGCSLKDTMAGSHVEEVCEQVRGRDLDPPAKGEGGRDESRDALTSLDNSVARLKVAIANTKGGMDLMEQSMEKAM